MNRVRIIGTALGLTALVGASGAAIVANTTSSPRTELSAARSTTDPKLKVPAGNKLIDTMDVERGVQVYQCVNKKWTFLEPNATLVNQRGVATVLHTRGPIWISTVSGSAVTAAVVNSVPRKGTIPELLLKSKENRGKGDLGQVSFIQRLRTKGGVQPTGNCTDGTQVGVPYQAVYKFYAPRG